MGPIVYREKHDRGWLHCWAQHAGAQQPCRQPCQEPRSSSPSHHFESPWAHPPLSPHLFQPLPKTKVGVNLKASPGCRLAGRQTSGFNNMGDWPTLGSGFPVMVLSSSWRCSQLPWEYQPGLSSDGSPSLSSSSLTGGEDGESDTASCYMTAQHHQTQSAKPPLQRSPAAPQGNRIVWITWTVRLLPKPLLKLRFSTCGSEPPQKDKGKTCAQHKIMSFFHCHFLLTLHKTCRHMGTQSGSALFERLIR